MPVLYKGVEIASCSSDDPHFDSMKSAIDRLPGEVSSHVASICCGSLADPIYCVVVKPGEHTDEHKYLVNAAFNRGCAGLGTFSIQNWGA